MTMIDDFLKFCILSSSILSMMCRAVLHLLRCSSCAGSFFLGTGFLMFEAHSTAVAARSALSCSFGLSIVSVVSYGRSLCVCTSLSVSAAEAVCLLSRSVG